VTTIMGEKCIYHGLPVDSNVQSTRDVVEHRPMTYDLYLPSTDDVRAHLSAARGGGAFPDRSLHLLVGDFHSFAKLGVFIDDVPDDPPLPERVRVLQNSLTALAEAVTVHSVVLAISRPGSAAVSTGDIDWRDAFSAATAAAETVSHGVYVVTDTHVGRLGDPTSQAA
jgi:hypothetical protein